MTDSLVSQPGLEPKPEAVSGNLVDQLGQLSQDFASRERSEQEAQIVYIVTAIVELDDSERLSALVKPESQSELGPEIERAFVKTLETPYLIGGEEVRAWQGGASVAVFGNGEVAGLYSVATPSFEEYGDLRRFALSKAALSWFLDQHGKEGGLVNPDNFEYLESLGLEAGNNLFSGAATEPIGINDKREFIGTSGCAPTAEFMAKMLCFGSEADPGLTIPGETLSGAFDTAFAQTFSRHLSEPGSTSEAIVLPDVLRQLRALK